MVGKVLEFGCSSEIFALSSASSIDTKGDLCDCSHSGSVSDAHMALWSQWMRRSCNTQVCCNTDCFCCNCDIFILFWTTHNHCLFAQNSAFYWPMEEQRARLGPLRALYLSLLTCSLFSPRADLRVLWHYRSKWRWAVNTLILWWWALMCSDWTQVAAFPQRLSLSFCLGHHALQNCKNRVVFIFGWLNFLRRKHTDVDSRITEDFF